MPAEHKLIIRSREGIKRGELTGTSAGGDRGGFLNLVTSMTVNAPGTTVFTVRADSAIIDLLEDDAQIEHWRNGSMLFRSLYQGPQFEIGADGQEIMTAVCAGEKHLLSRAYVMWRKGLSNRSSFVEAAAETIMHDLVQYNITADATIENGRIVTNPMTMVSVEDDTARGEIIAARDSTGKPLLQELQELALAGGVDFDLIKTGAYAWVFRIFYPQLGVDRSATMQFSIAANNLHTLAYAFVKTDTKTVVVAGGSGEEDDRIFTTRYGPDYSVTNHRELFLSQTSAEVDALIAAAADQELDKLRPRKVLTFEVFQASNAQFGTHYNLGDIVSATYRDVRSTYKVNGVTINLQPGNTEQIQVELVQQ